MTLSVGHFKGRYEAWNWKYQIEDTITMTMELELQVDEASVNSQHNLGLGKQSNRELLFSLLLFSNNVICEATKLPLLFFLTNPSPLNFLLSRLNTPHPFNNQQYFQIQHCHLCLCSFFKLGVLLFFIFFVFGCSRILITFLFVVQACWVILVKLFVISSRGETRHPCVIFCLSLIVDHVQLIDERLKTHGRILTILYLIHSF